MEKKQGASLNKSRKRWLSAAAVAAGAGVVATVFPELALAGVGTLGTIITHVQSSSFTPAEDALNGGSFVLGSALGIYGAHGIYRKMSPDGQQHKWSHIVGGLVAGGALISVPIMDGAASNTLFGSGSVSTSGNSSASGTSTIP